MQLVEEALSYDNRTSIKSLNNNIDDSNETAFSPQCGDKLFNRKDKSNGEYRKVS